MKMTRQGRFGKGGFPVWGLSLALSVCFVVAPALLGQQQTTPFQQSFQQGWDAYNNNNYELAITCLNQAIQLSPQIKGSYDVRGMAYNLKGDDDGDRKGDNNQAKSDFGQAIADFNKAIQIDPGAKSYLSALGYAYARHGDYDKASEVFDQAIQNDPTDWTPFYYRGRAEYAKRDYDAAIADYGHSLQLDPKEANTWYHMGDAHMSKGDNNNAIADFSHAIQLNPQDESSYLNRGVAYKAKGDNASAITDDTQAIQLSPKDEYAYLNRGLAYEATGAYDKAVADFTQVIQLHPGYAAYYAQRGVAFDGKGDDVTAIADETQAIQLDASQAVFFYDRGLSYSHSHDTDKAFADYNQAIQLQPNFADALFNRAVIYLTKGDTANALTDLTATIKLSPKAPNAYTMRGNAYLIQKDYDDAIANYYQASALYAMNTPAPLLYNLGLCYLAKGDYGEASGDFLFAAAADPKYWQACYQAADCYNAEGNFNAALRFYQKALDLKSDSPLVLNGLAWFLATCPQAELRDGKKAVEEATQACTLWQWKNPNSVDTLAAACAETGDFDNAVKWETQYLQSPNLPGQSMTNGKSRLALYQAHQPYHVTNKSISYNPEPQSDEEKIYWRGADMGALNGKYLYIVWLHLANNPKGLSFEQLRQQTDANFVTIASTPASPGAPIDTRILDVMKNQPPFTDAEQQWLGVLSHILVPCNATTLGGDEAPGLKNLTHGSLLGYYWLADNVAVFFRDFNFATLRGNVLSNWTSANSSTQKPGFMAYSMQLSIRPDLRLLRGGLQAVLVPDYARLDTALKDYARQKGVYAKYYSDDTAAPSPASAASAASAKISAADRLQQLKTLRDQGLITDDEYQKKRAEILQGL